MTLITSVSFPISGDDNSIRRQWCMKSKESGQPFPSTKLVDKSVQVTGTFGGGNLYWEGSNDGKNFYLLNDLQGNPLDFKTSKIEGISEICTACRPRVIGGDDTTNLIVTLVARK